MWEERFQSEEYVFGTSPAQFLVNHRDYLHSGQCALSVADGEGRNSVFMAECGLQVTALEFAPSAIAKARKLAAQRDVTVDFQKVDVTAHDWPDQFDLVVGIFIQFLGPDARETLFQNMKSSVVPGGLMLLHGYTPEQIEHGTGGPPHAENMYTKALLHGTFADWDILENRSYTHEINEGSGHSGISALVDFVARKPL